MGFETLVCDMLVCDMGSTLSGGQKQRVILARALYQRPEILFLDAPTEARLYDALRAFSITRIMIYHRPATVAYSDDILFLGEPA